MDFESPSQLLGLARRRARFRDELAREGLGDTIECIISYLDSQGYLYPDSDDFADDDAKLLRQAVIACVESSVDHATDDRTFPMVDLIEKNVVMIDESTFAEMADGQSFETAFIAAFDLDAAALAAEAAGERMMLVDDQGVEHRVGQLEEVGTFGYTPNAVAPVATYEGAAVLTVGSKGYISPAMRQTFVRILREELAEAGVNEAVIWSRPRQ